jgi:hypothetical protein
MIAEDGEEGENIDVKEGEQGKPNVYLRLIGHKTRSSHG